MLFLVSDQTTLVNIVKPMFFFERGLQNEPKKQIDVHFSFKLPLLQLGERGQTYSMSLLGS